MKSKTNANISNCYQHKADELASNNKYVSKYNTYINIYVCLLYFRMPQFFVTTKVHWHKCALMIQARKMGKFSLTKLDDLIFKKSRIWLGKMLKKSLIFSSLMVIFLAKIKFDFNIVYCK